MKNYRILSALVIALVISLPPAMASFADETIDRERNERRGHRQKEGFGSSPRPRQIPTKQTEENTPITTKSSWNGLVPIELKKQAPAQRFITNHGDWQKLWQTYRSGETVPKIDFDRDVVIVYVNDDPNAIGMSFSLSPSGDLKISYAMTLVGYTNPTTCSYLFSQIERKGIKSIEGRAL